MEHVSPWVIGIGAVIVILWIALTRPGRALFLMTLVAVLLVGAKRTFIRSAECLPTGTPCRLDLDQPTYAGWCIASNGAIESNHSRHVLISDGTSHATATCFDWRIFR
jgi:hypothetical protein